MTALRRWIVAAIAIAALAVSAGDVAFAQPKPADKPWMDARLLAAAQKEGSLIVYTSVNESEGLDLFKMFEQATGIRVEYVRAADAQLMAKMVLEFRASQPSYDIGVHSSASKLPNDMLAQFDPLLASEIAERARDPERRWYGVYQIFMAPAYNTKLVGTAKLPTSFEELAQRVDWAGRVALDGTDNEWVAAMFAHYGEEKARSILNQIAKNLRPVLTDGRLAMARSVGAGEYLAAVDNFVNLVMNVQLNGGSVDVLPLDPVALTFGQVSINSKAPHPNAARLAANFLLSKEAQDHLAKFGRLPTRSDVPVNPPGVMERLLSRKIVVVLNTPEQEKYWQSVFNSIFKPR